DRECPGARPRRSALRRQLTSALLRTRSAADSDKVDVAATLDRSRTERARLAALLGYRILDTSPEQAFDDLAELAAAVCDAPIASIAFVDAERSWFKATRGVDLSELPREDALSAEALQHPDLFVVPDAHTDPRYRDHDFVARGFRFFAGMPLRS